MEHYRETGIRLTGSMDREYAPPKAIELVLYRCTLCGALVDNHWPDGGMDTHTAWHATWAPERGAQ